MAHPNKEFTFDTWAEKFALNQLNEEELQYFSTLLSHNNKLREELCDWLKGLRDLGWPGNMQCNEESKK